MAIPPLGLFRPTMTVTLTMISESSDRIPASGRSGVRAGYISAEPVIPPSPDELRLIPGNQDYLLRYRYRIRKIFLPRRTPRILRGRLRSRRNSKNL